jgi:hypothetical protein
VGSLQLTPWVFREPRGPGTSAIESRYRVTSSKDMTVDTLLCVGVIVNCKMWPRPVSKSPINPVINPELSIVTQHTRDNILDHIGEAPIFEVGMFVFRGHLPMMHKILSAEFI